MTSIRLLFLIVGSIALKAASAYAAPASAPGAPTGAAEYNLLWQTFQVVLALAVTLVLLIMTVWVFKKIYSANRAVPGGVVRLIEIRHVDPKKAIALVGVMDRVLIVGWGDNSMTLLGELTPEEASSLAGMQATGPNLFGTLLSRFTVKTPPPGASPEPKK
jgi:flagellar biogenesis protein FliO